MIRYLPIWLPELFEKENNEQQMEKSQLALVSVLPACTLACVKPWIFL